MAYGLVMANLNEYPEATAFLRDIYPKLLAPLPPDLPGSGGVGAGDDLPSVGEWHRQLPQVGRGPRARGGRRGVTARALRSRARRRPSSEAHRRGLRSLPLAREAGKECRLR